MTMLLFFVYIINIPTVQNILCWLGIISQLPEASFSVIYQRNLRFVRHPKCFQDMNETCCTHLFVFLLALSEVSCKTLEGFDGLKMLLYHVALSMKDSSSSSGCGSKLLARLVSSTLI